MLDKPDTLWDVNDIIWAKLIKIKLHLVSASSANVSIYHITSCRYMDLLKLRNYIDEKPIRTHSHFGQAKHRDYDLDNQCQRMTAYQAML